MPFHTTGGLLSNPLLDALMALFSQSEMPPINFRQPFGAVPQKRQFDPLTPKNIVAPPGQFNRRPEQGIRTDWPWPAPPMRALIPPYPFQKGPGRRLREL